MTSRPADNLELIKRVLGPNFLELELKRLSVEEILDSGTHKVVVETADQSGASQSVEGEGCGLVDALFAGLLGRYAIEYQSLKSIKLANFRVESKIDAKTASSGVDAVGVVTVEVTNSEGKHFQFSDASRSITQSTAQAVLAVVEYFINAERAFITLYKARQDAIERKRTDLVTRYTQEMAEVVRSTSYAEVIETIKNAMK